MARIEFAPEFFEDVRRIAKHMRDYDIADIPRRISSIISAIDVLTHSPWIGHPVERRLCELVIGRGAAGYLVLYRFVEPLDKVSILALRHQRENRRFPRCAQAGPAMSASRPRDERKQALS